MNVKTQAVVTIVTSFAQAGTLTRTSGNMMANPIMTVASFFANGLMTPWRCQSITGGPKVG